MRKKYFWGSFKINEYLEVVKTQLGQNSFFFRNIVNFHLFGAILPQFSIEYS